MITLPCLVMLACTASDGDRDSPARDLAPWNGQVEVYGALRSMFHEGQTGPMVSLRTLLPNPDLYAVGALTELSGEITVLGGTTYLSYPDGDTTRTERVEMTTA